MLCNMPGNTPEQISCCWWLRYPAAPSEDRDPGTPASPAIPPGHGQRSLEAGEDLPNLARGTMLPKVDLTYKNVLPLPSLQRELGDKIQLS